MKNPFFISPSYRVAEGHGRSAGELLALTGGNTGNLIFVSALKRVVKHDFFQSGYRFNPDEVRDRHDGLLIPAANWLNGHSDWGGLAQLIEKTKLPCVVVGLGAQAPSFNQKPKILPGTIRFAKIVSDRCSYISTRGPFSAEVLNDLGIKNIKVTGCPSLLFFSKPAAVLKSANKLQRISTNATRDNRPVSLPVQSTRDRIGLLITRWAWKNDFDYVAQTELPDMEIALKGTSDLNSCADPLAFLQGIYMESDANKLHDYISRHTRVFFDAEEWLKYMSSQDFVLGTRLHGVIAGLLVGTPSVLIVHDTRTLEMAVHAGIPHVRASSVLNSEDINVQSLFDQADFSKFNERQKTYYSEFVQFFNLNNVAHNLGEELQKT